MKKIYTKALAFALSLMTVLSLCSVCRFAAAAEENTVSENSIWFQDKDSVWKDYSAICCYITDCSGENVTDKNGQRLNVWGARACKMDRYGSTSYWYLDLDARRIELNPGHEYTCIFTAARTTTGKDWFKQTCDLIVGEPCFGKEHAATIDGSIDEISIDQNRKCYLAAWTNVDSGKFGRPIQISSIGNVIGSVDLKSRTRQCLLIDFIENTGTTGLLNALKYNGKTEQATIDDIARALDLDAYDVEQAVETAAAEGVTVKWSMSESSLVPQFPKTIWLNESRLDLVTGDSERLYVLVDPINARNQTITWSNSNPKVAGFSNGRVTAKSFGKTVITAAAANGKTCKCSVTVFPLKTPELKKAQNVYGGVKVSWKKVSGAVKYRVFRKDETGGWKALGDTSALSFTDKSAKSDYMFYTVRCVSGNGKTFTSSYDFFGSYIKYCPAPKISKMENTASGVKLSWAKVSKASKYRVYVKNGSTWKKLGDTAASDYTATSLKSGVTYTFTLRCLDKYGDLISGYNPSGWSQRFIAAPKISSLSNTRSGVVVRFNRPSGAEKFRIYRKTGSESWTRIGDVASPSFIDKTAKSGKTYSYTVRCISKNSKSFTSGYDAEGKSIKLGR